MIAAIMAVCVLVSTQIDTVRVKELIHQKYYKTLPDSIYNLPWDEFSKNLDPYTRILDSSASENFRYRINGIIQSSIGAYFDSTEYGIAITRVLVEGSAYSAGLMKGDIINSINGSRVLNLDTLSDHLIYGSDSVIDFNINRCDSVFNVRVYKGLINKSSVYSERINNTGIIDIHKFGAYTYLQFMFNAYKIQTMTLDTLIIDLRGNPGGRLDQALYIADEFINGHMLMLKAVGRTDSMLFYSDSGGSCNNIKKLIVIQDSNSASASEVLCGILKTCCNAEVIGKNSYGKGVIQDMVPIPGGDIMITIGEYFPGGTMKIHGIGIPVTRGAKLIDRKTLPFYFDAMDFRNRYPKPSVQALEDPILQGCTHISHILWEDNGILLEMLLQKVYE